MPHNPYPHLGKKPNYKSDFHELRMGSDGKLHEYDPNKAVGVSQPAKYRKPTLDERFLGVKGLVETQKARTTR